MISMASGVIPLNQLSTCSIRFMMRERFLTSLALFGKHAPYLFTVVLLVQLPLVALGLGANLMGDSGALLNMMVGSSFLLAMPFWIGALLYSLARIGNRGEIEITEAYRASLQAYPYMLPAFMLSLLAMFAGFMLLILPGIYIGLRLSLVHCVVLFERKEPVAALRRSWALTEGRLIELVLCGSIMAGPGTLLQLLLRFFIEAEPAPIQLALFNFIAQLISLVTGVLFLTLIQGVYADATRPVAGPPVLPGELLFRPLDKIVKQDDDDAKG
jgi:hypothetical protein